MKINFISTLKGIVLVSAVSLLVACGGKKDESEGEGEEGKNKVANVAVGSKIETLVAAMDKPMMVMQINIGSIIKKSNLENLESLSASQSQGLSMGLTMMDKVGVDMNQNMYFFVNAGEGETPSYGGAIMGVGNKDQVKKMISQQIDVSFGEKDGFDFAVVEEEGMAIGLSDGMGVMVYVDPYSGLNVEDIFSKLVNSTAEGSGAIKNFSGGSSDLSMIFFQDHLVGMAQNQNNVEIPADLQELYQGATTQIALNFENDQIVMVAKNDFENLKNSPYNVINDKGVDASMYKYVAMDDAIGMFAASFNMANFFGIMELAAENDPSMKYEEFMSMLPITEEQMKELFTGDIVFAMHDMGEWDEANPNEPVRLPSFSVTIGSGAVETLQAIMDEKLTKGADGIYSLDVEGKSIYYAINEGKLVVTSNSNFATAVASGSTADFASDLLNKEKPMAGFFKLAFDQLPAPAQQELLRANPNAKDAMEMFQSFTFEASFEEMRGVLKLNGNGKNSLEVITNMVMEFVNTMDKNYSDKIMI